MANAIRDENGVTGLLGASNVDGITPVIVYADPATNRLLVNATITGTVTTTAGTEYTEDAAAPADPVGATVMMTRDDALAAVTEVEGDWSRLRGTAEGALWVQDFNSDAILAAVDGIEALLATIDADTGGILTSVELLDNAISGSEMQVDIVTVPADPFGANADAAATAGSTGSMQAKFRLMTSQLDAIKTAVETLDNTVGGSELQVDVITSALPTGASTLAEQQSQTTHLATIAGDTTAIETAIQIMDDWDETDRAKVNLIAAQAGITGAAGAVAANTPRVTLASDDPAVASLQILDNAISGSEMQVDVVGALPAGTNNIGDVDVLTIAAGDNNIGNVDIVTVPADPFGANADAAATAGSTGSIQAKLRLMTSQLDAIKTSVETLDNTVGGTELQVDVVGALPAGTNAIGKLAANSGVDIGDVDVTSIIPGTGATNLGKAEDAAHTSGDVGILNLGVRVDNPNTALTNTDADYSPLTTNKLGSLRTALLEDDFAAAGTKHVKKYYTNAGAVTDGIIWSPAAGTRWYVTDIFIQVSAAATVTLEDDLAAGDAAVWKAELAANSGWSHSFHTPLFSGEDAADLLITTSAGNVYVMVTGYEV